MHFKRRHNTITLPWLQGVPTPDILGPPDGDYQGLSVLYWNVDQKDPTSSSILECWKWMFEPGWIKIFVGICRELQGRVWKNKSYCWSHKRRSLCSLHPLLFTKLQKTPSALWMAVKGTLAFFFIIPGAQVFLRDWRKIYKSTFSHLRQR